MGSAAGIGRFGDLSQEEFAARCRAARAYADLTLEEAGKLMGVSRQALSRRENGWVKIQTPDRYVMATVLCELTGWPESVFTDEKWPPIPEPNGGEVEPGEVSDLVEGPLNGAEQG